MDRQKIERSIKGLSEWQMHVQAESDIDTNISTAIEALKAQLSREGTTSDQPVATDTNIGDTISRQVAIDRFNVIRPVDPKKDEYTKGIDVGIAMCVVAVKDQPTIQPVATDTNVGDTISRQQAIDALMDAVKKVGILDADDIKAVFDMLPIIQPVATDTNVGNNSEIPNSSDTISRQQAIDALAKFVPYAICDESTESYTNGLTDAYNLICQMPSAQPNRDLIDDYMWKIKQNISTHTAADGVIAIKYYLEQIYEQIYGKGEKPKWMI